MINQLQKKSEIIHETKKKSSNTSDHNIVNYVGEIDSVRRGVSLQKVSGNLSSQKELHFDKKREEI